MRSIFLAVAVLLTGAAWSASPEVEIYDCSRASFLSMGVGPRAVGMGEAFTAVADDATAVSWNPAGLYEFDSLNAIVMHSVVGNGIGLTMGAGAYPVGPGVAGLGVTTLQFGSYDVRDELGDLQGTGSPLDIAVCLGYAIGNPELFFGERGSSGLSLEFVSEAYGGATFAAGLGTLVPLNSQLSVALSLQHMGPPKDGFGPPSTVRAGGAYRVTDRIRAAADLGYGLADRLFAVSLGGEWKPHPLGFVRLGYRVSPQNQAIGGLTGLAFGLGARMKSFGLDYAFQPFGDLATVHRFALVYATPPDTGWVASTQEPESVQAPSPQANQAQVLYQESVNLYNARNYDAAWGKAYQVLQIDPVHWQAWQMIGNCQYAKGDKQGALGSYQRSLQINPNNAGLRTWYNQLAGQQ